MGGDAQARRVAAGEQAREVVGEVVYKGRCSDARQSVNAPSMAYEANDVQRLGDFILANMEDILAAWEDYARKFWVGPMPSSARLRNDAEHMLRAIVEDMGGSQSLDEQKTKSEGMHDDSRSRMSRAAQGHALSRVADGFDIIRMVAEFRALRASVCRLWWESIPTPHREQIRDMERFNEAVDQLVAASVGVFTERVDRSRRIFLGILGHDLRQPLATWQMLTGALAKPDLPAETVATIAKTMGGCCDSMAKMLSDLLDFTCSQLKSGMPVYPVPCDLGKICEQVVQEIRVTVPDRVIELHASGEALGEWDPSRLKQLISNLLANALHHGSTQQPVVVTVRAEDDDVMLEVHNSGQPIPEEALGTLFDPMVRLAKEEKDRPHGSIGLGLYICRQVAAAHKGDISVVSTPENGTTFAVKLPKRWEGGSEDVP